MEGVLVNQHLGEADRFSLRLEPENDTCRLVESRPAPVPGGRMTAGRPLAELFSDCKVVLSSGAGDSPTKVLNDSGVEVMVLEGVIEDAIGGLFRGEDIRHMTKNTSRHACSGTGGGCG